MQEKASTITSQPLSRKKKLLFMLIWISFFFLGTEILWRGLGFKTLPEAPSMEGSEKLIGVPLHPGVCYSLVPNASGIHAGVQVKTNSLGFRDGPRSETKSPETLRILVLGDSMVFGQAVDQEKVFTRVLEKKLGPPFEVWNAGHCAYNTKEEYFFFKHRGLKFQPDLVILGYCLVNDTIDCQSAEKDYQQTQQEQKQGWFQLRIRFEKRSAFFHWLAQNVEYALANTKKIAYLNQLYDEKHWTESAPYLRKIYELCQIRKIPLYLLIFPITYAEEPRNHFQQYEFSHLNQKVRQTLDGLSEVTVIDLLPALIQHQQQHPDQLLLVPYDGHPNEIYHSLTAEVLSSHVRKTFSLK
ncbi:MAG: hypothetical protein AABZ60_02635 [Planctomycetota bacterium]